MSGERVVTGTTGPALGFPLAASVRDATARPRADHRGVRNLKTCELQHPEADRLVAGLLARLGPRDVRDYPYLGDLIARLAGLDGVAEDRVALTAGSSAAIGLVVDAIAVCADRLVLQEPEFDAWPHHAALRGVPVVRCRGLTGHPPAVTTEPLAEAMRTGPPAVVALTNPGNPGGQAVPLAEVAALADLAGAGGHLLVVDECYGAFGGVNHVPLLHEHPNLLVLRSLSKSWALAGARLAVVFGHPELLDHLRRFRADSTVSGTAAALALGLTARTAQLRRIWADVARIRDEFAARVVADHPGWTALPSAANFVTVLAGPRGRGDAVARFLAGRRVRVRGLDDVPGLAGGFRVSVAEEETMREVADLLREVRC
jgi:histidinol-phosphate/aromatic aminotransferase/cobyric acid decarboxylase-like protein